jgi:hypothetical protein
VCLRALAILLLVRTASAEERAPPPDPSRGERYDGLAPQPNHTAEALALPRAALFPVRGLFLLLKPPIKSATEFEAKNHVTQRLVDAFTWRNGTMGLRPEIEYSLNFAVAAGLRFFDDQLMGPRTAFELRALTGGANIVHADLHGRPTASWKRTQLIFLAAFDRRDDLLYGGIDSALPLQPGQLGAARYSANALDFGSSLHARATQALGFSLGATFGWRRFGDGRPFGGDPSLPEVYCVRRPSGQCIAGTVSEALVPGFHEGTQFFRASGGVRIDLRNDPVRAATGLLVDASADYSHGLGSDDSSYLRVRAAVTVPVNLWGRSHVLLLRVGSEAMEPFGSQPVPFSELPTLGGPEDLRGFREQRFRGHSSFLATAEYRWPIWMWLDGVIFVDYGGVMGSWYANFDGRHLQPDVGGGLRVRSSGRFHMRVQVAYGFGEGWRFFLSTSNWP